MEVTPKFSIEPGAVSGHTAILLLHFVGPACTVAVMKAHQSRHALVTVGPSSGKSADESHALVARLREGDERAFAALFRRNFPTLRVYLYRLTGSVAEAEELAQDVFVKLWEDRRRLTIHGSVEGYLFAAARNHAFNHLKHEKVARRFAERVAIDGEPLAGSMEQEVDDAAIAAATQAAIDALPERCREIFLLSRAGGRTYGEIAAQLGLSIKTVETQMTRALAALRTRLAHLLP